MLLVTLMFMKNYKTDIGYNFSRINLNYYLIVSMLIHVLYT
jgi:hypothetical protein